MKLIDLTGKRYGKLFVLSRKESCATDASWLCECECGNKLTVSSCHLKTGHTKSCGCLKHKPHHVTHGLSKQYSGTYRTWKEMRQRCLNPKSDKWKWYGGRGITICDSWKSFKNFLNDMGTRPCNKTLDRIDNNGNYTPDNCQWATQSEQVRKQENTKLNMNIVNQIRADRTQKRGYAANMARKYGVTNTTMSRAINGKTWQS